MHTQPGSAVLEGRALHPANWLLVAGHARAMEARSDTVRDLLEAGHTVSFVHFDRLPAGLGAPVPPRRISAVDVVPRRVRRLAKGLELALPLARRVKPALAGDAALAATVAQADYVLFLDDSAARARRPLQDHNPAARFWSAGEVEAVLDEERWWRYLDRRLHQLSGRQLKPSRIKGLIEAVTWLDHREPARFPPPKDLHQHARGVIHGLVSTGRLDWAHAILQLCRRVECAVPSGQEAAAFRALEMQLRLHDEQVAPERLHGLLEEVFASADSALEAGFLRDCAGRTSIGLDLMFHPRLHTDVASTPLVETPDTFTAPFYQSRVGQLLISPATKPLRAEARPTRSELLKVTFLPGSYPWHAARVLEALEGDPRAALSVVRLRQTTLQSMSIGEFFVSYLLARALPDAPEGPSPAGPDQLDLLKQADVVVADWGDKGAVWASRELPESVRMVVRVHSADVLSAGVHLVDWTRVEAVIFVSQHLRQVFTALLGARATHLRLHVIPNILAALEPGTGASDSSATDDGRTIAMVGWGRKVKDPIMALDILAALREREQGWRLRLIGADFEPTSSQLHNDYYDAFRRRAAEPDLVGAIDFVGHTDDVPGALAGCSFILSTSLRESFHIGAMEGIVAGAVPIIREWPAFARYHGASGLFPAPAVFETVGQAVDMIWSLRDPAERLTALRNAQESMRPILDGERASRQLLDVILR